MAGYHDQGFTSADEGMASGAGIATGFGMSGTSDLYNSEDGLQGRNIGMACLQLGSAAAGGAAAFSSAAGPGGTIAGVVFGVVGEAVGGGLNAYDAQKTIAALKIQHKKANRSNCQELGSIIESCMAKAKGKRAQGVAKATVAGQPGVMAYRTGRAIYKAIRGTKGKGRKERSERLYHFALNGNPVEKTIAQAVIVAICGDKMDQVLKNSISDAMKS